MAAAQSLPPVELRIDRARSALGEAIDRALRSGSVAIAAAGSGATAYRIDVSDQHEERRSRTLTRGIQVAEYELIVTCDLVVTGADGTPLAPRQRLAASRVYAREQENLLTNEAEEDVLWAELRRDVAEQLVIAVGTQIRAARAAAAPAP